MKAKKLSSMFWGGRQLIVQYTCSIALIQEEQGQDPL
jgi:hypothetical protein